MGHANAEYYFTYVLSDGWGLYEASSSNVSKTSKYVIPTNIDCYTYITYVYRALAINL